MANITKQTPADLSIIWAASGDTLRPTTTKIGTGWEVEIPPRQWFNWLDNKQDAFIAHVNQHGMPLWDSSTEYQNATSYVIGSNGIIYRCIQTHTNKDPVTAGDAASFWVQAFDPFDTSYTKAESDNLYLAKTANLSDLTNTATARTNLSVYSKSEADSLFLDAASNLSDLQNNATARTNLDVYSKAEAAQKNGDSTKTFDVATPTTANHATTKTYVDTAAASGGLIKQIKYAESTTTSGTVLTLAITPVSTSNKFKISVKVPLSATANPDSYTNYEVRQNSTNVLTGYTQVGAGGGSSVNSDVQTLGLVTPLTGENTFTVVITSGSGQASTVRKNTIVIEEIPAT